THLADPDRVWRRDQFAGTSVELRGQSSLGRETVLSLPIKSNTANRLEVDVTRARQAGTDRTTNIRSLNSYFKSIASYTIDYNPSQIQPGPNHIVREVPRGPGRVEKFLLYKKDSLAITGELLSRVYKTQDERVQPAVGFEFNAKGGRKFGEMTRRHLPKE